MKDIKMLTKEETIKYYFNLAVILKDRGFGMYRDKTFEDGFKEALEVVLELTVKHPLIKEENEDD